jgi:hypothetical protein
MKRTIGLISVVAIVMALTIVFSGVALASHPVLPTKETEILDITTNIKCNGSVVESQRLSLEIDSDNLLDNPPLAAGEKYGKIGHNEKMIASNGTTTFNKSFNVDTGTTPNLNVTKNIGYKSGYLGSLSHAESVDMSLISRGSFVYVSADSSMSVTDVNATTETSVWITKAPVNLNYKIDAVGTGFVSAGVDLYAKDGRGADNLGSRMSYKERALGYGKSVHFTKDIGYNSIYKP